MRVWPGIIVVAVLGVGGYAGWTFLKPAEREEEPPPPVPVSTARAKQAELPVYLRGIGTIRALNAVEIHPQVSGVLLQVPVKEGQEVRKGDVLAVVDPRPYKAALDKAVAQKQQDQAQLENAQLDARRYTALARNDFASRQQVDTQAATVERLQGVVAGDDAAIEAANINLGFTVVHAPLNGRVGLRRVDPGNLIGANATGEGILSVVQIHPISVVFTLPERQLPSIRAAVARGPVPVLADTSDGKQELARGVLLTTDNAVDTASGTIELKAVFDNQDGALTPGQFVNVRLQSDVSRGIAVPREAVQHGLDGLFVLLVKADGTADRRPVEVSYDNGTTAVVGKGLAAEDQVVVSGQSRVSEGTRLSVQEPRAEGGKEGGS